jgi:hypothetical protein
MLRESCALSPGEREIIAHAVLSTQPQPTVSAKLLALLTIARKLQLGGGGLAAEDIVRARGAGADDQAICDTLLIATTFSVCNLYINGLRVLLPEALLAPDTVSESLPRLVAEEELECPLPG